MNNRGLYIVLGIVGILLLYVLIIYNSLIKLNNVVSEAFATMDVYLKKRWDLIPSLVEIVKSYAKHEKETLESLTKLRNSIYDDMSSMDKLNINERLTADISRLMILVENYPDLKANANFLDLSSRLSKIEDDIANSRKYYNAVVRNFNNKAEIFPNNIIAYLFGYQAKRMFEASAGERDNVKVKL